MSEGFYVYRLTYQDETLYIGKGSSRRLEHQRRNYRLDGEVIWKTSSEKAAYKKERELISMLNPRLNKCPGGGGSWVRKPKPRKPKGYPEIEATGPRRYVARFLLRKLDERNCERWGLSKVDINRMREVAHGPWC